MSRTISDRTKQRQFAPALDDVRRSTAARRPSRAAAETSKRLKRGQVGVLDAMELGQPLGGQPRIRAEIAQPFSRAATAASAFGDSTSTIR